MSCGRTSMPRSWPCRGDGVGPEQKERFREGQEALFIRCVHRAGSQSSGGARRSGGSHGGGGREHQRRRFSNAIFAFKISSMSGSFGEQHRHHRGGGSTGEELCGLRVEPAGTCVRLHIWHDKRRGLRKMVVPPVRCTIFFPCTGQTTSSLHDVAQRKAVHTRLR